jgi:LEA14-like dessication related protein
VTPRAAALVLTALALLAGGCATLSGINPPRVNVSNVTPQDMTLFEQRFLVQLRVQNPNDMDLELKAMTFDLDLNGKSFATGLSNKAVTIPRFGSNVVDVEVISGLTSFLRQLKSFTGGTAPRFAYRLRGKLYLEKPVSTTLPFDEAGELELPGLTDPVK